MEQFFGQGQSIFGYRNLRVTIRFAEHDLYPNVDITWDQKFPSKGSTEATNIQKKLVEYLPDCMTLPCAVSSM